MVQAIRFYWECAREAAHGTIERVNSWFWLVGLPIVAFSGWYWEVGELTIPDNTQGFMTFMVVTVIVTWIIFFFFRLLGAPARLYARVNQERRRLYGELEQTRSQRAFLEIGELRMDQIEVWTYWKFPIHNIGPAVAENIVVELISIVPPPLPQDIVGILDFPLSQRTERINVGSDAHFKILNAVRNGDRWQITEIGRGINSVPHLFSYGGEYEFSYRAHGANAETVVFTLAVTIHNTWVGVVKRS